ncbi:hypothetical protein Efla_004547 [Eimeria flavescens]
MQKPRHGKDIRRVGPQKAKALVRPTPKHYKGYKTKHKRIPRKELLKKVTENQSPKINEEGQQGGNGCALSLVSVVGQGTDSIGEAPDSAAVKDAISIALQEDKIQMELMGKRKNKYQGYLVWEGILTLGPARNSSSTDIETGLSGEALQRPAAIRRVVHSHKQLFCENVQPGLPLSRVVDHTITLLPGQMPLEGAVYRVVGAELEVEREILQQVEENKWVSLSSSPVAAPPMMITKSDDASEQKHFRIVYGFKVMPFELKGVPGTFQANVTHMFFHYIGEDLMHTQRIC